MSIVVTPIITATHAEWMATSTPIVQGRILYETDTGNYKVGDGTSVYSALAYDTNISTFTNYLFMVGLDQLADLFVGGGNGSGSGGSGSSGSSVPSLWQPGAPDLTSWTPLNVNAGIAGGNVNLVIQENGTQGCTVTCAPQHSNSSQGIQWGGFYKPAPAGPYKILFGFKSLITAYNEQNGSSTNIFIGNPMGVGWTDGSTSACWFTPGFFSPVNFFDGKFNHSTALSNDFTSNELQSAYQLTDGCLNLYAPHEMMYILSREEDTITISETNDGLTEHVIYTTNISGLGGDAAFANILVTFGANTTANNGGPDSYTTVGGCVTNFFLYDEDVGSRSVLAPGY